MSYIVPVINTKTVYKLKERIRLLHEVSTLFQIDIADGKFTPWKTWNAPQELKKIIKRSDKFELHLMIKNPEKYIPYWLETNPQRIIIQVEAIKHWNILKQYFDNTKTELALAIKPYSSVEKLNPYLKDIHFVTFLSVTPGPSGQKFKWFVLDKIVDFKKKHRNIRVEIDGGVNENNIEQVKRSGVDFIAMGSAIFNSSDPKGRIRYFQKQISIK